MDQSRSTDNRYRPADLLVLLSWWSLNNCMSINQEISQTTDQNYTQLLDRIAQLEAKIESLTQTSQPNSIHTTDALNQRVSRIEETLLLLADIHRYGRLQELLAAKNFYQADLETISIILSISGESDLESITPNDVRHFSCHELRVIDTLWTTYSQGRFGFSVQAQVYQSVGGSLDTTIAQNDSIIVCMGEKVGWRKNNTWRKCDELDYSLNAPPGCHPSRWWNSPFGSKMTNFFLARLITCEI